MSQWFHRNPLKATDHVKFELKGILSNDKASKICSELRIRRDHFIEHLASASYDRQMLEEEFNEYLALFGGFVRPPGEEDADIRSKLYSVLRFRWTNSMLGSTAVEVSEAYFELLSLCLNMAIWYTKHAAWLAGKDEVREGDAKMCHTCLRKAAGIFAFVRENCGRLSGASDIPGSDFDPKILLCYETQCSAEAQEVTLARAIELKHAPTLISALANETSMMFAKGDKLLESLDESVFGRWRKYMQLKGRIYSAYAYAFLGESLLAEDKCGDAVRACQEGVSEFHIAEDFCSKYAKSPGPGFLAQPDKHLFFRRVEPLLNRHLEKAKRENGFIYHQKVPEVCPELDSKANFGLAKPEPFALPKLAEAWTTASYAAFDISKADMPDFSKLKKSSKDIPAVKEEKIYQTDKDPSNSSGCVIS
ncbi:hypothetical protein QR680_007007 [Steinernema hermaphroditum]|uniref:BRO1 domain-containing protein n=1 Tax=Steinernema hermaphroditum TaxID=289476 RepID=A0AA39HZN7_9BILA|nr:hypothetical protein QR680_007007 [Steinernema hermaphroditum]